MKLQEARENSDAKEQRSVDHNLTYWKRCFRRPDIQTSSPEKKLPSKLTCQSPEFRLDEVCLYLYIHL